MSTKKGKIPFVKYHGTGNDFIIINHLSNIYVDTNNYDLIASMCHRRFGIGADGVMFIEKPDREGDDFKMLYYNADGKPSSMCGNGGRCISAAFLQLKPSKQDDTIKFSFENDQYQSVYVQESDSIQLSMNNVENFQYDENNYVLNTGSPHFVQFRNDVELINVKNEGSSIRYNEIYKEKGINVNFCQWNENQLLVRTYERGVEDETYSCGTGVVAASIAFAVEQNLDDGKISVPLNTMGGKLNVSFVKEGKSFSLIQLTGPAVKVFDGFYIV